MVRRNANYGVGDPWRQRLDVRDAEDMTGTRSNPLDLLRGSVASNQGPLSGPGS
jgi:hypothetical protein